MVTVCSFFFFSSRRRHTRYWRDWSSDVCSSDLERFPDELTAFLSSVRTPAPGGESRSEERRVGKECRSRRAPHHLKKKHFMRPLTTASNDPNIRNRVRNRNTLHHVHYTGHIDCS